MLAVPESVRKCFVVAGWRPGRRSPVSLAVPIGHPAAEIPAEFGGLTVTPLRQQREECAPNTIRLRELWHDQSIERVWADLLGSSASPACATVIVSFTPPMTSDVSVAVVCTTRSGLKATRSPMSLNGCCWVGGRGFPSGRTSRPSPSTVSGSQPNIRPCIGTGSQESSTEPQGVLRVVGPVFVYPYSRYSDEESVLSQARFACESAKR